MPFSLTDDMTEDALRGLIGGKDGWRAVVRDLVKGYPAATPNQLIFALTSAGSGIESTFAPSSPAHPAAGQAYRLAALVAADLFAMQVVGTQAANLYELQTYWHRYDDYFLTL